VGLSVKYAYYKFSGAARRSVGAGLPLRGTHRRSHETNTTKHTLNTVWHGASPANKWLRNGRIQTPIPTYAMVYLGPPAQTPALTDTLQAGFSNVGNSPRAGRRVPRGRGVSACDHGKQVPEAPATPG